MDSKLNDKKAVIEAQYQEALAKLDKDTDVANSYAEKDVVDDAELASEVQMARIADSPRRTKNNPILVGEAGVGKTAIAEGIAHRIVDGDVPRT